MQLKSIKNIITTSMVRRKRKNLRGPEISVSGKGVGSIVKNAGYLLGTKGLDQVARFLYVIVLAHYLGPELYGLINYGISWYIVFLSFSELGISAILIREIGRDKSIGAWIASVTLTLRSSAAVIAAAASGILGWFFESKPEVGILLIVFSIALVGRSLAMWTQSVFTAYETSKYTFRLQAIFRISEVLVGTALLLAGGGVMTVAIVHAISWWLQALGGLVVGQRHLVTIWFNWSWHEVSRLLVKGLPIGLGGIMSSWLQMGPLVLYRHLSPSENSLGQLALAVQALVILFSFPIAIVLSSLPILSRSVERQDRKEMLFVETMTKAAFLFGGVAGLAGLGAGPWLVQFLFGTRYLESGHLLGLVMWLLIPYTCGCTINGVFLARGRFYLIAICTGFGALVMSCIFPLLVSIMDTSGAIIASGSGMGVWALSSIWILARSGDLDVRQTVLMPLVINLFALVTFFALKPIDVWFSLASSWVVLLCGTLLVDVLSKNERHMLMDLKLILKREE